MRLLRLLLLVPALVAACFDVSPHGGVSGPPPGGNQTSFAIDILPIFQTDCITCHGGAGGLDLESYQGIIQGGVSGPVLDPTDPDDSLILKRLDGRVTPTMPLDGPLLPSPEIDRIRQWIAEGAQDN